MHAWILDLIRYYFRNTHILNTRPGKCVIAKVSFFKVFKKKEVIALRILGFFLFVLTYSLVISVADASCLEFVL